MDISLVLFLIGIFVAGIILYIIILDHIFLGEKFSNPNAVQMGGGPVSSTWWSIVDFLRGFWLTR